MRTTIFSTFVVITLSAGCASAPRAQTATAAAPRCAVAAVVTQPEEVVRDPGEQSDGEAPVVADGADTARGQAAASAAAPRVVAHQDAAVTPGNGAQSGCAYDVASAQQLGVPRS